MNRSFSQRVAAWIDRKYRFLQKMYYGDKFMHIIFSEIRKKNIWTGKESISGPGSSLEQTKEIRKKLPSVLKKFHIGSLLDIPCGDFYWMEKADLHILKQYIGADILEELIASDQKLYGNNKRKFVRLDIAKDKLPKVDMIFVRDCLVHFSYADIQKAINNMKKSNSTYLFTTTFISRKVNENIITGYWRPLNLQKPPFSFPKPLFLINEKCTEEKGKYKDKSLALWKIADLP